MGKRSFCVVITLGLACASFAGESRLPAFPGAEGFGAFTVGGRGGRVIKVTNLKTSGPGSLQAACSAKGPRIVVFEVSGVIPGDVRIAESNITVLGQTAPGGGITINGMLSTAYRPRNPPEQVIVRFLRVRTRGGRGAQGDAIQFSTVDHAIIDHVSCSWAEDETIDIYSKATNISIQWCTITESRIVGHEEGRHNYGLIAGRNSKRISIHHNLFAHHARRIPAIGGGPLDFRNNVAYNFRDGMSHEGNYSGTPGINLIGNYYKIGPSDPKIFPFCFQGKVPYYLRDNYIHGVGMIQDPWKEAGKLMGLRYYAKRGTRQEKETPVAKVITHAPKKAYELILARAGAFPRDAVTKRIVQEVKDGTGKWGMHAPKDLMEGLTPAKPPRDSDGDGMPDAWEKSHALNPSDRNDHKRVLKSGYTAIEEYGNEMAAWLLAGGADEGPHTGSLAYVGGKRDATKAKAKEPKKVWPKRPSSLAVRPVAPKRKADPQAVAAGRKALIEMIVRRVKEGVRPKVYVDILGKPTRASLTRADASGFAAEAYGGENSFRWPELTPRRFYGIARRCADSGSAAHRVLLARYCAAALLDEPLAKELQALQKLDAALARKIRGEIASRQPAQTP